MSSIIQRLSEKAAAHAVYTSEDHAALVAHIAQIERDYRRLIEVRVAIHDAKMAGLLKCRVGRAA